VTISHSEGDEMTVPVAIVLDRLFCYKGADEGSESEPYLWVIGFTIDGRTITHAPDAPTLTGSPAYFFSPGSHGNIGGGVRRGTTRRIPPAVGRFATTLQPIVLNAAGRTVEVPGQIGMIAILLEEDMTSDAGAEAAHQAINTLVQTEVDEAVADINLAGLAAQIATAVGGGTSAEEAAQELFAARIARLVSRIQRYARAVAVDAIVRNLRFPSAIVEGADPDDFMGLSIQFFDEDALAQTEHDRPIEFTDTIAQPGVVFLESSDYVYNLHGRALRRVKVHWTPITSDLSPGRWQVTGVAHSAHRGKRFLTHIGGRFSDGSPWQLPKGKVMDLLVAQTHTFFVRGESGLEADVIIQQDPINPYFPSLTTTPDSDPTNNLGRLPVCPLSTSHLVPVD
jgi:hypothetical protein